MNHIKKLSCVSYKSLYFVNDFVRRLVIQKKIQKFVEHRLSISRSEEKDGEAIQRLIICLVSDWRKTVRSSGDKFQNRSKR